MPNLLPIRHSFRLRFFIITRSLSLRFSFVTVSSSSEAASSASSGDPTTQTHVKSIGKWDFMDQNSDFLGGEEMANRHGSGSSLKDLLLRVSDVVPDISRRFRRFPVLRSENVLELLLGFESEFQKGGIGGKKVETLWEIFKWADEQYKGFKHLNKSYEIMASMLIREGMVKEVEILLIEMEKNGNTLDNKEIFSDLIQKYVSVFDSEKAIQLFDWMRGHDLVPLTSCYQALIDHLIQLQKTEPAFRICLDWVEITDESNDIIVHKISQVIQLLCLDQRVQEARSLVRKLIALGCKLSSSVFDKIALGYCEKQDFEDLLNFISEMNYTPNVSIGNRIIHVLCRKFGVEKANEYMEELELLGFNPDEITLGILIGWSCYEGNIRRAFHYLSEIVSKGLQPKVYTYNAIISELFRKGLWEHSRHILDEMKDNGIELKVSTFKIMLAGYCKAREFKDVRTIIREMIHYGLIEESEIDDPLFKAFVLLGFNPLSIKLKRDNHVGFSKTEFFDELGNGLYLDTDTDAYEERLNMILDRSMLPNFNLLIVKACNRRNLRFVLELVDEMVRCGQELSPRGFTALVKNLCSSSSHVKVSASFLKKWPKLANQLSGETLNFLVQEYCKKGFTDQARLIFNKMVHMNLSIHESTYTLLIKGLCKKGTVSDLLMLWDIARKDNWIPNLDSCEGLWDCLIHKKMVTEAIQLFDSVLTSSYRHSQPEICKIFIEKLCGLGFSHIAHSIIKRFEKKGFILDYQVYSNLMKGLCMDRNVSTAFAVLNDIKDKNFVPGFEDNLMLIPQLCKATQIIKAMALADLCLKSYPTDSYYVYHALTEGLCSSGLISDAENQFRIMLSNGFIPENDIYQLMFRGYCKVYNLRKIDEVFGNLIRKKMNISVKSYREYVRSMCSQRRIFDAIRMKEILLGENRHCNVVIYNILIFYLFQVKNSSLVIQVLDEMREKGVLSDENTYNFLVYGFYICKDFSRSRNYLSSMISLRFRPNNRSLRVVIDSLCDNREVDKALELSRMMESKGWDYGSAVITKIANALFSNGEIQEAEYFLIRVKLKGINYDNLIKKLCEFERLDMAVHLLNTMLKNGNVPDYSSFDSIIHGFLKCNQLEKSMDFHSEMIDRRLKPSFTTWNRLIHKFCETGQVEISERLVKSMIQMGETPTKDMFNAVIRRYRAENDSIKASEMMKLMQRNGYEPDFDTHWSLISNMNTSKEKGQGFLSRLLSGNAFGLKK